MPILCFISDSMPPELQNVTRVTQQALREKYIMHVHQMASSNYTSTIG